MVQVKKILKYGKYFLFLALASVMALMWPSKNGQSSFLTTVPHAYADAPVYNDPDNINVSEGAGDCP